MALIRGWVWKSLDAHQDKAVIASTGLLIKPPDGDWPHDFNVALSHVNGKHMDIAFSKKEVETLLPAMQNFLIQYDRLVQPKGVAL